MKMTTTMLTIKILSTNWLEIAFDQRVPINPPNMPPTIIKANMDRSNDAKPVVKAVNTSDDNWEKKMIKTEFSAASFAFIEKSKDKTATLNGPPPIPKNAAITPNRKPIAIIVYALSMSYVFIL